jgi:hypothetical protein
VHRNGDYHTGKGEFPSASAVRKDLLAGGSLETENRLPIGAKAAYEGRKDGEAG